MKFTEKLPELTIEFEVVNGRLKKIRTKDTIKTPIKTLTIPSSFQDSRGKQHLITSIGSNVLRTASADTSLACAVIEKLVLQDGIQEVMQEAFARTKIKSVQWAKTAPVITRRCFGFSEINEITNIESVEKVERYAFLSCKYLKVVGPFSSVKVLEEGAFHSCVRLEDIVLNNDCIIGPKCFFRCLFLKNFRWPTGCIEIPSYTFCFCQSLKEIANLDKVISIGCESFYGCVSLKSIELPQGLRCIEPWAFSNTGLESVKLPGLNYIPVGCFSKCFALKTVEGLENIRHIGAKAFSKCCELVEFTWPSKCTEIMGEVFCNCTSLQKINGLENIQAIKTAAFSNCCSLTEIDIPDGIKEIGVMAFASSNLKSFRWPSSCRAIPPYCFDSAPLETIDNIAAVEEIGEEAFAHCDRLTRFVIPETLKRVGDRAFAYCKKLKKLDFSHCIPEHIGNDIARETNIEIELPYYYYDLSVGQEES